MNQLVPVKSNLPVRADASVTIISIMNPFSNSDRKIDHIFPGCTLETLAELYVPEYIEHDQITIFVGEVRIPHTMWGSVRPRDNAVVTLKRTPQDPLSAIGLLSSVAGSFVSINGLTILGTSIVAGGTFWSAAAGWLISFAINAIGQALFGPSRIDREERSPTLFISGARNDARPYQPIPLVLGEHRMVPPYGAAPYTEIDGEDQYLRILVVWGYGTVQLSELKIGNTLLTEFEDVEEEHDLDGSQTSMEKYPTVVSQDDLSGGLILTTTYQTRTTEPDTTEIGVDIAFLRGLGQLSGADVVGYIVNVEIEYRVFGSSGSWTSLANELIGGETTEPVRKGYRVSGLTADRYDVRCRLNDILYDDYNVTGAVTSGNSVQILENFRFQSSKNTPYVSIEDAETRTDILSECTWMNLKSYEGGGDVMPLPGIAKSAFRIRATDQLNNMVDEINAVVAVEAEVWNGSSWGSATTTRNPAALFRHVLMGAHNKKAVSSSEINESHLGEWFDFCSTERFRYDAVIDYEASVYDILKDIAAAGRASPTFVDGKWDVIIQQPLTDEIQLFTPRNTRGFSFSMPFNEIPHGLKIQYINRDAGYVEDEVIVYDDGFDESNASIFQTISFPGQTKFRNVYKLGRAFLAAARLRPETWFYEMDIENLRVTRGDLVRCQHDVLQVGQTAGRITAISGSTVTLDEAVTFVSGTNYQAFIRESAGTITVRDVVNPGSTTVYSIELSGGVGSAAVGDLLAFGEETVRGIVASIEYLDDLAARIAIVPYDENFYTAGDAIPNYSTVISTPVGRSFLGPAEPTIVQVLSDEKALDPTARGDIAPTIKVLVGVTAVGGPLNGQYQPPAYVQARWKREGQSNESFKYSDQVSFSAPIYCMAGIRPRKTYTLEVRAISEGGATSNWVRHSEGVTVVGLGAKPPTVDKLTLTQHQEASFLEWAYPSIVADVIGYEIRYHPDQGVTNWRSMSIISDDLPRGARSFMIPASEGTYAIKAADANGKLSEEAKFVSVAEDDTVDSRKKLWTTKTEHTGFNGYKINAEVSGAALIMSDKTEVVERVDGTPTTRAANLTGVGFYYFGETDMGGVYSGLRLIAAPKVERVNSQNTMDTWTTLQGLEFMDGSGGEDDSHRMWLEYNVSDEDVAQRTIPEDGLGAATGSVDQGDTISAGVLTRNADFCFFMTIYFPENADGCIFEYGGGTANAFYLGITNERLVLRAGDGSDTPSTSTAWADRTAFDFYGRHGTIFGRIDVSAGTAEIIWTPLDGDMDRTFLTGTASAGFPSGNWAGNAGGGVGTILGSVADGENSADFNGIISEFRYWNSTYSTVGSEGSTTWSGWRRFARTNVTARNIRFRAVMATLEENITPQIEELVTRVRLAPEESSDEDLSSGTSASGYDVTFSPAFRQLKSINITADDLDSGDYWRITSKSRTGFTIIFRDSGGSPVDKTFSYQALGWGREKGT